MKGSRSSVAGESPKFQGVPVPSTLNLLPRTLLLPSQCSAPSRSPSRPSSIQESSTIPVMWRMMKLYTPLTFGNIPSREFTFDLTAARALRVVANTILR
ncbi:hypothetical protein Mapa_010991 [Marchantia paleacea]|nr:hypothetical protein Mapa_010991 [Marchantia paleacea]